MSVRRKEVEFLTEPVAAQDVIQKGSQESCLCAVCGRRVSTGQNSCYSSTGKITI